MTQSGGWMGEGDTAQPYAPRELSSARQTWRDRVAAWMQQNAGIGEGVTGQKFTSGLLGSSGLGGQKNLGLLNVIPYAGGASVLADIVEPAIDGRFNDAAKEGVSGLMGYGAGKAARNYDALSDVGKAWGIHSRIENSMGNALMAPGVRHVIGAGLAPVTAIGAANVVTGVRDLKPTEVAAGAVELGSVGAGMAPHIRDTWRIYQKLRRMR